jgi:hypothetical protein
MGSRSCGAVLCVFGRVSVKWPSPLWVALKRKARHCASRELACEISSRGNLEL